MRNIELKITCGNCVRDFTKADIEIKAKYLGAMITEQYYHCPYCNFKYIVGLFDNKFRELKRKGERLREHILYILVLLIHQYYYKVSQNWINLWYNISRIGG